MALEDPRTTLTDWPPERGSTRSRAWTGEGADGYRAHCATCGTESGPTIDHLPRARFAVSDNGDLVMHMAVEDACMICGCSEVAIGLRRRRRV
jgi:hypothetical protein